MRKMQKHFRDQVRSSCRCRRYPSRRTTAGIGSPVVPDPRYAGYCVGTFGQPKMGLPLAERRIQLPGARFVGQPLVGIHCLFSWSLRNATAPGLHKAPSVYGCGPDIGPLAASIRALTWTVLCDSCTFPSGVLSRLPREQYVYFAASSGTPVLPRGGTATIQPSQNTVLKSKGSWSQLHTFGSA